jgi:hypothetical protein
MNTLGHWFLFCHFPVVTTEACEEVTENSGDGAEAVAPIPASSPTNKKKRKSGKTSASEEECLNQALNFIMRRLLTTSIHLGSKWPWS